MGTGMGTAAARAAGKAAPAGDPTARIRNIGIMAHVDAGKTTTTERILFYSGVISHLGEVDDGSSVTDWMQQEQERGISITAAATTFAWNTFTVNLIDTPGHVDFTMEVEGALRVLDGAIAVFDAVAGVEPQSETVWRQADRHHLPRIAFVNKCDRPGADPAAVADAMRLRLGAVPLLIQLPLGLGDEFAGVVDLITMKARRWDEATRGVAYADTRIPAAELPAAEAARAAMIEILADLDDGLMTAWVAGGDAALAPALVHAAIRTLTVRGQIVPTLVGAARRNKGIHNLLDAVCAYLPSPRDREPTTGTTATGEVLSRLPSASEPLTALAFKVMRQGDEQLTFVRVYAGTLTAGQAICNATRGEIIEIPELVQMRANRSEAIAQLATGMIGAIVTSGAGARLGTGDTLCDPASPLVLHAAVVPDPVMGVVVEPNTDADHGKLIDALARLAIEDPSFRVRVDADSQQIVVSGMGELHLEILVERVRREYGVNARVGRPQVAYRETITQAAAAEHRFIRQAAPGAYGHVQLRIEPTARGTGYVFANQAPESEIPREHVPAVRAGITETVERGVVAGFPMTDIRIDVVGGSYHPVDSSNQAFKIAGTRAFIEAVQLASPTVLEPVMALEVVTPDECLGDVLGDLHARRGKIAGISARTGVQTVACFVPMASMFGYSTDLRSRTRGRATYAMELDHYAEVPHGIREHLFQMQRASA